METSQMRFLNLLLKGVEYYELNVVTELQNNASLPFLSILHIFVFSKAKMNEMGWALKLHRESVYADICIQERNRSWKTGPGCCLPVCALRIMKVNFKGVCIRSSPCPCALPSLLFSSVTIRHVSCFYRHYKSNETNKKPDCLLGWHSQIVNRKQEQKVKRKQELLGSSCFLSTFA